MDRTTGANYVTNAGKRQFTDGPPGTTITGAHMTAIQEEIMAVIEGAGIAPDPNTLTQLRDAILATVSAGGFFGVPAIGLSIGSGGEGAWVSGGNSTMEGEHHFTDFTLQSAHQLSVGSTGILIIRCTGTATINGSINGNGYSGFSASTGINGSGGRGMGGGGAGGTISGGSGAAIWSTGYSATSPTALGGSGKNNPLLVFLRANQGFLGGSGGNGSAYTGGSGGGSLSSADAEWSVVDALNFGIFLGGGGGGGAAGGVTLAGRGGGGGGGGCFVLIVAKTINISGSVTCNGGTGGGAMLSGGGGGGGGGGVVMLVSQNTPVMTNVSADGGAGGAQGGSDGVNGFSGTNGFAKSYHP